MRSRPRPLSGSTLAAATLAAALAGMPAQATAQTSFAQIASAQSSSALAPARLPPQITHAELRPGWQREDGTHVAALHLQLADGWRTYWRIPGDAGIEPQLDWSRSQNAASIRARWPRPVVFDQNGYRSIGYERELVLPLEVTPRRAGRPVALSGKITIGICQDICIPVDLSLGQVLRGGDAPDGLIAAALTRGPESAEAAGLDRAVCRVTPGDGMSEIELRARLPRQRGEETLVVELPGTDYWISHATSWREGDELVARARVRAPRGAGAVAIERASVAFTVLTEDRMLTHRGCTGG